MVGEKDLDHRQSLTATVAADCVYSQEQWWLTAIAWVCLVWCLAVTIVCWVGFVQL